MRTLIRLSFITMFLVITIFSAQAAIDPNLILYFSFDEQIDGKRVEDLTGGVTMVSSSWVPKSPTSQKRFTKERGR